MSTRNSSRFTPIIIAISVVAGILIGTFYAKHFAGNRLGIINGSSNKLNALLRIVDDQYVDTVNMTDLVEKAMPQILAELDPHSTYIPAQNLEEVNSELEGSNKHYSGGVLESQEVVMWIVIGVGIFFALVNWTLAYFRFKESEIINRM